LRVLITGVAGFVGGFLAEELLRHGAEVHGLEYPGAGHAHLAGLEELRIHDCDIRDPDGVRAVLYKVSPDRIFHLAARSFVSLSWKSPAETFATNVIGQVNLLEAVRDLGLKSRIQIAGSSEEYGMVREGELPIREENPLRPLSPYAVSKVAQDLMGYQYFQSYRMDIVRTRAFNHTGPRRHEHFVLSNFSKQVAMIEAGLQAPVLLTGNLDVERDFLDVRDVVRAYRLALEKGEAGEVYNISSGRSWCLRELVDRIVARSSVPVEVRRDPARLRPSDLPVVRGTSEKFTKRTGWRPEIPIDQTLQDLLDYWREKIRAGGIAEERAG
jgi:GDP-4-dehydro-6-deoxy-D-mannose reductase